MYMNTGYLNKSHQDFKDKRQPIVVGSCGCYRLSTYPKLPTYRPRGRLDYQIIYIASGKGYFHFDSPENETIVPAGNIVLFRPKELQKYEYYGKDKTEVYWIHFTGSNIKNLLRRYGFADKKSPSRDWNWAGRERLPSMITCSRPSRPSLPEATLSAEVPP